jgi:hypothetical protein
VQLDAEARGLDLERRGPEESQVIPAPLSFCRLQCTEIGERI